MEKNNSLSASTAWYSIGNFFIRSISFILIPLYSNVLTTGEYGNYALLMSLYTLAAVFYQAGMQSGLTKFYLEGKNFDERKRVFSTVFNTIALISIALSVILILFSRKVSFLLLGEDSGSNLIILLSITLFVDTLCYYALQLLKTKEKAKKVVQLSAFSALLNLILNFVLVYSLNMKIEGILWAQLGASLLLVLTALPYIIPELSLSIDKTFLKILLIFSLPLMISGLFSSAVDVSDRFLLALFTSKTEVGVYSLSYRIALVMNVFVIAFRTAWTPHGLNLYYKNSYKDIFGNTLKKYIAAACFILLTVTLFAPYFFTIKLAGYNLINTSYKAGLVILPFVLLGYLFNGISSFYSIYALASSRSYHLLVSDGIAFVINIGLNLLFIPMWGMLGAAIATTASFIAAAIYLAVISGKAVKISYPIKDIVLIIIVAAVTLLLGMLCKLLVLDLLLMVIFLLVARFGAKIKISDSL